MREEGGRAVLLLFLHLALQQRLGLLEVARQRRPADGHRLKAGHDDEFIKSMAKKTVKRMMYQLVVVDESDEQDDQNEGEDGSARQVVVKGIMRGGGEVELDVPCGVELHGHLMDPS